MGIENRFLKKEESFKTRERDKEEKTQSTDRPLVLYKKWLGIS